MIEPVLRPIRDLEQHLIPGVFDPIQSLADQGADMIFIHGISFDLRGALEGLALPICADCHSQSRNNAPDGWRAVRRP